MDILVFVKPVPDPDQYNEIRIDEKTKRLIRTDVDTIIDPMAKNALEEALRLREEQGGTITVVSMAPPNAADKLRECLAMGADRAVLISDPAFAGADTYATSYVLAKAVEYITDEAGAKGFDLILAGNESADGATSHVPVQVAEWLGIPHAAGAGSIEMQSETEIIVTRRTSAGVLQLQGKTPALISVVRDINKPRHISAMGIVKARKKPLTLLTNAELKLDTSLTGEAGSPTKAGELLLLDMRREAAPLTGEDATAEDAAKAILSIIRKAGIAE